MGILRKLAGLKDEDAKISEAERGKIVNEKKHFSLSNKPKSYKEAYDLAYEFIGTFPLKTIKIIKYIDEQNLPVKTEDIFYVNSLASLAVRPIFREIKIAKNLFEKVIAIKNNDFESNSTMFFLSLAEITDKSKIEISKKYAKNLLSADYAEYLEEKELPILKITNKYKNIEESPTYNLYKTILEFFIDFGEQTLIERTKKIIIEIEEIYINN